jgi:hypothetical protein
VRGTETQNQSARSATNVEKGTVAELSLAQRMRFIMKNRQNTTLKIKTMMHPNNKFYKNTC